MEGQVTASRVFWPVPCPGSDVSGYVIGWNVEGFTTCVAGVIPFGAAPLTTIDRALLHLRTSPRTSGMVAYCGSQPVVLGEWHAGGAAPSSPSADSSPDPPVGTLTKACAEEAFGRRQVANLWLRLTGSAQGPSPSPSLTALHCCGAPYTTAPQIVFLRPPDPTRLEYLVPSLENAPVSPPASPKAPAPAPAPAGQASGGKAKAAAAPYGAKNRTREEEKLPPPSTNVPTEGLRVRGSRGGAVGPSALTTALRQVNSAGPTMVFLMAALGAKSEHSKEHDGARHLLPLTPPVVGCPPSPTRGKLHAHWTFALAAADEMSPDAPPPAGTPPSLVWRGVVSSLTAVLMVGRWGLGGLLLLLNAALPGWLPVIGGLSLRRLSSTATQLDRLATQLVVWPAALVGSGAMRRRWQPPPHTVQHHVASWGSLIITGLDVALGLWVGLALWGMSQDPSSPRRPLLPSVGRLLHMEVLRSNIEWLSAVPAGLKLNVPLASQLAYLVLELLSAWNAITTFLTPLEPAIAALVAVSGVGGLSLMMALVSDILHGITIHVRLLYKTFAWAWRSMLGAARSLFLLFRGRKFNVLRVRVDSLDPDTPQLLLGVLLFALMVLLPTISVFYAFFTAVWGSTLALQGALWGCIALLNRFPLYGLLLRASHPQCMPGGVRVRLCQADGTDLALGGGAPPPPPLASSSSTGSTGRPATYVWLHSYGAPAGVLLGAYAETLSALVGQHYSPARVLASALGGSTIHTAPQDTFDRLRDSTPSSKRLPLPPPAAFAAALRSVLLGGASGELGMEK